MDLYEALRKGTTDKELRDKFEQELGDARKRIEEEDNREHTLKEARNIAAVALKKYIDALDEKNDISVDKLVDALKNYEKFDEFKQKMDDQPILYIKHDNWLNNYFDKLLKF